MVNLELDDNFKVFFDLVYLYIFIFYRSWPSCNRAKYPEAILVNICTLVYISSKVIVLIIKSHDKYQSYSNWVSPCRKGQFWKSVCFSPLSIVLERVATSGDPLSMLYKRGH